MNRLLLSYGFHSSRLSARKSVEPECCQPVLRWKSADEAGTGRPLHRKDENNIIRVETVQPPFYTEGWLFEVGVPEYAGGGLVRSMASLGHQEELLERYG